MKIAIIGAGGVRTPLIIQAICKRQDKLGISELSLMDIDGERLELIGALSAPIEQAADTRFSVSHTTEPRLALRDADFVLTTFRVGGSESRVTDERVPLRYGILGQETTGPGGFAMGLRSIPVILEYVKIMQEVCPEAWLINFANPAGMLTEAVIRNSAWRKVVGICDAPAAMHRVISAWLRADPVKVHLDYIGLNHLGWILRVLYDNRDRLPEIIESIISSSNVPGVPFDSTLVASLRMIPNEYLYYYYYTTQAINHILAAGETRGEQIARQSLRLLEALRDFSKNQNSDGMLTAYQEYMEARGSTYMATETGKVQDISSLPAEIIQHLVDEGYAGVALDLVEGLSGIASRQLILNVPNHGAASDFDGNDVLEMPTVVKRDDIQPLPVGQIPSHCLGLMLQVKQYERWTIEAAVEGNYQKACLALTSHPLVRDYELAVKILDEYICLYKGYFPVLH